MNPNELPERLVARINPLDARAYAAASGWLRVPTINGKVAVYSHPKSDLDQLLIPLDVNLSDYPRRMAEVVVNLAEDQGRPAPEVLNDLLLPPSDVLRFTIDEPDSQTGAIPLEQGLELLQGRRKHSCRPRAALYNRRLSTLVSVGRRRNNCSRRVGSARLNEGASPLSSPVRWMPWDPSRSGPSPCRCSRVWTRRPPKPLGKQVFLLLPATPSRGEPPAFLCGLSRGSSGQSMPTVSSRC